MKWIVIVVTAHMHLIGPFDSKHDGDTWCLKNVTADSCTVFALEPIGGLDYYGRPAYQPDLCNQYQCSYDRNEDGTLAR